MLQRREALVRPEASALSVYVVARTIGEVEGGEWWTSCRTSPRHKNSASLLQRPHSDQAEPAHQERPPAAPQAPVAYPQHWLSGVEPT
jgi:hypothetical protein